MIDRKASRFNETLLTVAARKLSRHLQESSARATLDAISRYNPRHVYLLGGAPRDTLASLMFSSDYPIADFDIVVDVDGDALLSDLRHRFFALPTSLGGIRIGSVNGGHPQDVWILSDSPLLRCHGLEPSIDNLVRTALFDINSVAYDICCSRMIVSQHCADAFRSGRIGFLPHTLTRAVPSERRNVAVRALLLAVKMHLRLGKDVRTVIRDSCDPQFLNRVLSEKGLERYRSAALMMLESLRVARG